MTHRERRLMRRQLTVHHRIPQVVSKDNSPMNLSYVPRRTHEFFHALFGTKSPYEIADELSKVWIDPHYRLVVERILQ